MADVLFLLADLGRASVGALWLPLGLWTLVALVAEGALRLVGADAAVGLPVRGATLAALPVAVTVPGVLGALTAVAPDAAAVVSALAPASGLWLPEVVVGGVAAGGVSGASPAVEAGDVLLGAGALAVALAGAVAIVGLVLGALRLRGVRQSLSAASPAVVARLDAVRPWVGVDRPVAAAVAPAGVAPFTLGWRRPLVAVPNGLDGDALDVALAHELAHVRRADFAWHAAERAVTAAFAAHPLVHVLARGLALDRERAADAIVLDACPGSRRPYADLLFSFAQFPAPTLALGASPSSSSLKSRIHAMNTLIPPDRRRRRAHLGRLTGLLAVALVTGLAATMAPRPIAPGTDGFTWSLDLLMIDGAQRGVTNSFTALSAERFDNLVLIAEPYGSFTISDRPFEGAEVAGRFDEKRLAFRAGGHSVVIDSGTPYFSTSRDAYVRHTAPTTAGQQGSNRAMFAIASFLDRSPAPQTADEMFSGLTAGSTRGSGAVRPALRDTTDEVYEQVEDPPELIGGLAALQGRIVYPPEARADGVEGRVIVQFVVDEEGRVTDAVVARSPDERLSEAALAAVRSARFTPGRQDGEAVKVRFSLPITFRLPNDGEDSRGPVFWDTEYSDDLERLLDRSATMRTTGRAGVMARVAFGAVPFEDLAPGSATLRFTVADEGRATGIEVVEAASPAVERFARFYLLGTQFTPEAVGREGTVTYTVTRVGR